MTDNIKCDTCKRDMKNLGNVKGVIYTSNPAQWDETYVCDTCRTKKEIRVHGVNYDPTGGRDLATYLYIMSETNTKFTPEQIKVYGEMYNLFPLNHEAMIANMMRQEGMIQDLQAEVSLMK